MLRFAIVCFGLIPMGCTVQPPDPLAGAARSGNTQTITKLLAQGADARAETPDGDSALAAAVSGVPDIDKFTLGRCQTAAVAALLDKAPDLTLKDNFYGRAARLAARAAGCAGVLTLIERKQHTAHAPHGGV